MIIHMPNLSLDEIFMLESAQTEDEWKTAVNRIKLAREGHLPPDWDYQVVHTGLHARVNLRFSQIMMKENLSSPEERVA